MSRKTADVLIVMGSDSDLGIMSKAAETLEQFNVSFKITVCSAHRTPEKLSQLVKESVESGAKAVIAGAGGAAHLPGVVAALTTVPVIGVPIKTSKLNGMDSLLSIVQMPDGIPVATVAIDGAKNAALLACEMLALSDPGMKKKMSAYRESLKESVLKKSGRLEEMGYRKYLAQLS